MDLQETNKLKMEALIKKCRATVRSSKVSSGNVVYNKEKQELTPLIQPDRLVKTMPMGDVVKEARKKLIKELELGGVFSDPDDDIVLDLIGLITSTDTTYVQQVIADIAAAMATTIVATADKAVIEYIFESHCNGSLTTRVTSTYRV
jgi:hypothetical protein